MQTVIEKAVNDQAKAVIYFKLNGRAPLFGNFVNTTDSGELLRKGYFRFVADIRSDEYFATKKVNLTSLFTVNSLFDVKIVK